MRGGRSIKTPLQSDLAVPALRKLATLNTEHRTPSGFQARAEVESVTRDAIADIEVVDPARAKIEVTLSQLREVGNNRIQSCLLAKSLSAPQRDQSQPQVTIKPAATLMKTVTKFLKVTLVGGLLVVLPVWVSLLLLLKAIKGAMAMLMPIAKLLPQGFVHEKVAALVLLLVICFVVGLLIRTGPGRRFGDWLSQHILDRIPGFSLMRGITRQLAGKKGNRRSNQPSWRSRTHWRRHSSLRNMRTDSSQYSSHPVRRRWRGYIYFATRTRASGGCAPAQGDDVCYEGGCRSSRDACRDSARRRFE
jgi:Protein of unknown function (DUF502).